MKRRDGYQDGRSLDPESGPKASSALQESLCTAASLSTLDPLFIGLIAHLTDSVSRQEVAASIEHLRRTGLDILGAAPHPGKPPVE